jgi:hypothetical protein
MEDENNSPLPQSRRHTLWCCPRQSIGASIPVQQTKNTRPDHIRRLLPFPEVTFGLVQGKQKWLTTSPISLTHAMVLLYVSVGNQSVFINSCSRQRTKNTSLRLDHIRRLLHEAIKRLQFNLAQHADRQCAYPEVRGIRPEARTDPNVRGSHVERISSNLTAINNGYDNMARRFAS